MFTHEIYDMWMEETQMQKYRELKDFLPQLKNPSILDVGCGPGWIKTFISEKYKQFRYIGVDVDKNSSTDIIASGDKLPFKSNTFDIVLCIDTLHLLNDTNELVRVVRPGGYLIISLFLRKASLLMKLEKNKNLKLISKNIIGDQEKDLLCILQRGPWSSGMTSP